MTKKLVTILLLVTVVAPLIFSLIDLQSIQANASVLDHVPQIRISQENGTVIFNNSTYHRDYDPPELVKNIDLNNEKNITVHKNETITVSYQSPCGIPESINGIFLDGEVFEVGEGKNQILNLTGHQSEFYENNAPRRNGTELANIPTDLEAGDYKLVVIIDCDDSIDYYISNARIK